MVSLPASRIGTVDAGVSVIILMMSYAACVRKLSIFTAGKLIFFREKDHSIIIHFCYCGGNVTFYATIIIEGWPYITYFLSIWVPGGMVNWFVINDELCYWWSKGSHIEIKLSIEKTECGYFWIGSCCPKYI